MVVDQFDSVDQIDGVLEPAIADQADPQAVVPEHCYPLSSPPALGYVQDPVDDAESGGAVPELEDEQEYVEFPNGPEPKPKQEHQDGATPSEVQLCNDREIGPAHHPTKCKDG